MRLIDEYFLQESDRLFYLNLKQNIDKIDIDIKDIPLPLLKEDFMEQLSTDEFSEEIDFNYFIKGMIYNIAIDPNFKYFYEYKKILETLIKDLGKYIFIEGMKKLSKNDKDAIIYFRANYILEKGDSNNNYYYSILLNKLSYEVESKFKDVLFIESDKILNEIIKKDPEYPMSYDALGDIEVSENNFIKANSYYKEALNLLEKYENMPEDAKLPVKKEIEKKIISIEADMEFSEGLQLLQKGDFYSANKKLMNVDKKIESGAVKYYIGFNLMQGQENELASKYMEEAKKLGYDELNLFIDLSYIQATLGKYKESIETISEGLLKYEENENLLYNRAIIYSNMGQFDKALEDLNTIISYDDISDEMFNNAMILKEKLDM